MRWLVILSVLAVPATAVAQRNLNIAPTDQRVALVIGNAAYTGSPLRNPVNDARAVGERLQRLGFVVIKRENLKTKEIGAALREFRSRLSAGGTALFFYAGHGIQVRGNNYLPAVDADIEAEEDVSRQSMNVSEVLDLMEESKTKVNLVFLDACRNNPFARKFRSASRGLAKVDAASGTLISFATRPGSVAADGEGKNGLYTEYLLKHMEASGVPIEQVLKRVGAGVKLASKGAQEPWSEGFIENEFYFRTGAQLASAPAASPTPSPTPVRIQSAAEIEQTLWDSVKGSRDPNDFKEYLSSYPSGRFAALARTRLRTLTASPAQTAAPAVTKPPQQQSASVAPSAVAPSASTPDPTRRRLKEFGEARSVVFSADGSMALIASSREIGLVRVPTLEKVGSATNFSSGSYDMSLSTNESSFLVAGYSRIAVWDSKTLTRKWSQEMSAGNVARFTVDDRMILASSGALSFANVVWLDAETGKVLRQVKVNVSSFFALAVSPDGRHAAAGGYSNTILFDVVTGQVIKEIPRGGRAAIFTPDGANLLLGDGAGDIFVWSITGERVIRELGGHRNEVKGLSVSRDGKFLFSGSQDNTVIFWNLGTGAVIWKEAHAQYAPYTVAMSPDATRAISVGIGTSVLWNTGH